MSTRNIGNTVGVAAPETNEKYNCHFDSKKTSAFGIVLAPSDFKGGFVSVRDFFIDGVPPIAQGIGPTSRPPQHPLFGG